MPFDQTQELTNLVRLGLSTHILQVDQFPHLWMDKDVMTAFDPRQVKTKSLRKCDHLIELDALWARQGFLEQFPFFHRQVRCPPFTNRNLLFHQSIQLIHQRVNLRVC